MPRFVHIRFMILLYHESRKEDSSPTLPSKTLSRIRTAEKAPF